MICMGPVFAFAAIAAPLPPPPMPLPPPPMPLPPPPTPLPPGINVDDPIDVFRLIGGIECLSVAEDAFGRTG